ncbi:hypothetical protein [Parasynechococcus marenigrum]|jgi:hypothetical protein|uniref:Uncharacterized protein n=1 Tax=Parasynechococcus marenigrum (strain WH8102) TaxID=84588 RepID=Q7U8G7_PARMW|nr:hypothetical protein [Parasynechococcus marenigrum]QNJ13366.1 hypothetical protein SynA18461_00715 [Synechococcus sp. A18-46.1]CAE07166.1 conserved hypothetical protein [Parasynechococcus marenigrum WH 8102]
MAGITPIGLLIGGLALWAPMVRAETMSPETIRKVARLELARSIRAFAAGSLANGECLVRREQLSQQQANQATAIALQEMGISAAVLENPQVRKAADLLGQELTDSCDLSSLDDKTAQQLVRDEL